MNKIAGELNTRLNFLFLAIRPVLKIHISFKWNWFLSFLFPAWNNSEYWSKKPSNTKPEHWLRPAELPPPFIYNILRSFNQGCVSGSAFIFPPGSGFLTFEHSFMFFFLQIQRTLQDFFLSNLVKLDLDPDPHSEKLLDPDPHKMHADPQPCFWHDQILNLILEKLLVKFQNWQTGC